MNKKAERKRRVAWERRQGAGKNEHLERVKKEGIGRKKKKKRNKAKGKEKKVNRQEEESSYGDQQEKE